MTAPISNKVSNGALLGAVTSGVCALLVFYVPSFKSGLPGPVTDLVTALVGVLGYFAGGWLSSHKATVGEIQAAIADARAVLDAEQQAHRPDTVTDPASPPALPQH